MFGGNKAIAFLSFLGDKAKMILFQLHKCECALLSLLLYDSHLNIFALWTEQNV